MVSAFLCGEFCPRFYGDEVSKDRWLSVKLAGFAGPIEDGLATLRLHEVN